MKKAQAAGLLLSAMALFGQSGTALHMYQDRFATRNGLRIHYLDWGSEGKPPLIMLHGIGRVAHSFDHIALEARSEPGERLRADRPVAFCEPHPLSHAVHSGWR